MASAPMAAGNVVLVSGTGILSRLIALGQGLPKDTRPYRRYTHVALLTGDGDEIIQAVLHGVQTARLSDVTAPYAIVDIGASAEDRAEAVAYARSCVGDEYGTLALLSIALALITGGAVDIHQDKHRICSQLVAEALERTRVIWPHDPSGLMPADIARRFSEE